MSFLLDTERAVFRPISCRSVSNNYVPGANPGDFFFFSIDTLVPTLRRTVAVAHMT